MGIGALRDHRVGEIAAAIGDVNQHLPPTWSWRRCHADFEIVLRAWGSDDDRSHRAILYARDVAVVELRDREEIAAFLRRRPAVHAYALGDLDDFFWPHTRWLGLAHDGKLAQVALVYDEPDPPVLLALAEEPQETMAELLVAAAERLPPTLYAHVSPSLLARIEPALAATTEPVAHKKLGLVRPGALSAYDT